MFFVTRDSDYGAPASCRHCGMRIIIPGDRTEKLLQLQHVQDSYQSSDLMYLS